MIAYQVTADASTVYRDTASAPVARQSSAGDVGNAMAIMRDAKIIVSAPVPSTIVTVSVAPKV